LSSTTKMEAGSEALSGRPVAGGGRRSIVAVMAPTLRESGATAGGRQ